MELPSFALHDQDSWRLPDWEAFSESGQSAWTDDSDADSLSRFRPRAPPMASTATLTTARRPFPLQDLKALHLRFAQERASAGGGGEKNDAMLETQAQIATQLERVREELRAFQQSWHTTREEDKEEKQDMAAVPRDGHDAPLRFDMAVQTDVASMNDDALRQWLHLITQKMEVLTTSFHGDTTQLPLQYPLQPQLERPVTFSHDHRNADDAVASWHVGGSLKTLVSKPTAERLLDLERAVACLATATRETTSRYVEYFEAIVVQIQDLHQQRLRQVVDESLEEMKNQRARYRKRIEQLETECRAAKAELATYQQKTENAGDVDAMDSERLNEIISAREQQWKQERQELVASIERLEREQAARDAAKADAESHADNLRTQLAHMTKLLEVAQRQSEERGTHVRDNDERLRQLQEDHRAEIERLEQIHTELRAEIRSVEEDADAMQKRASRKHADELRRAAEAATAAREREIQQLQRAHAKQSEDLDKSWRLKLQDAEETKRLVPVTTSVDQQVQTDHELLDEGSTDERIARLKKRCKALETLLDKKFEDSSSASVASIESGRWSMRSPMRDTSGDIGGRTLPLTMSMESSLDDTFTSSHAANTPSRDDMKARLQDVVWETSSNRSTGSLNRAFLSTTAPSDPDTPSPEAMLALVRKLESLATSSKAPTPTSKQPDEEPDFSAATTPTRKSPASSRPTSASLKKPTSSRSSGLAGSYSAAMRTLKDPRRQQQGTRTDRPTSSSSASAKQAPSRSTQRPQRSFASR